MIIDYNIYEDYAVLDNYVYLALLGCYNSANVPIYIAYTMLAKYYNEIILKTKCDLTLDLDNKLTNEITLYG